MSYFSFIFFLFVVERNAFDNPIFIDKAFPVAADRDLRRETFRLIQDANLDVLIEFPKNVEFFTENRIQAQVGLFLKC